MCAEQLKRVVFFKIRLVLSSFFSQVMFGMLFEELLEVSIYENNFIYEMLATCLEVCRVLRVKYHGVHCNLEKGYCNRRCLGQFMLIEQ